MKRAIASSLLALALALGCDGETINAGNDGDGGAFDTYRWKGAVSNSYGLECPYPISDDYAGQWEGEFDDHTLPSGSKKVRVTIEGIGYTGLCGSITFGDGDPPPIPTDPAAPYAPGLPGDPAKYERSTDSRRILIEGFPYEFGHTQPFVLPDPLTVPEPLTHIEWSAGLKGIRLNLPYKAWCNMHLSYHKVSTYTGRPWDIYSCVPGFSAGLGENDQCFATPVEGDSAQNFPVPCTELFLCDNTFCDCSTDGCTVSPQAEDQDLPAALTFEAMNCKGTADIDLDPGIDRPLSFRLTKVGP